MINRLDELVRLMPTANKYGQEMRASMEGSLELRQRNTLNALNAQFRHAREHSPLYASRRHLIPGELSSFAHLENVPFTTKEDLREAYPKGMLAVPMARVVRYGESTGTSGPPTSSLLTFEDWERGNAWLTLGFLELFRAEDVVFIAVPYELTLSAHDISQAFSNLRATVVPVGALSRVCPWSRVVNMMVHLRPSVLVCTPSRALRLYDLLCEQHHDPKKLGLETLLYVGETASAARLQGLVERWQIRLLPVYGATETNVLAVPCRQGAQHVMEGRYHIETVDPVSGQPVREEERGELVLTSLYAEAMPLIRYRTGDLVSVHNAPCPCGLPFRTLRHYGRVDATIVLGARQILKFDLEQTVLATPGAGLYFVCGNDNGVLHVIVDADGTDGHRVRNEMQRRIRDTHGVDALVETADRLLFCKAMDTMSKPGGLSLEQVVAARTEGA